MTESEWLASNDSAAMLTLLESSKNSNAIGWRPQRGINRISDRKLRLFACAASVAYGTHARIIPDTYHEHADMIRRAELWADSGARGEVKATDPMWHAMEAKATDAAQGVIRSATHFNPQPSSLSGLAHTLRDIVGNPYKPVTLPKGAKRKCAECGGTGELTTSHRFDCYDCDGKGFIEDPCPWRTPQVMNLAAAAYEHRVRKWSGMVEGEMGPEWQSVQIDDGTLDPFRLALLADALEDAGCPELMYAIKQAGPAIVKVEQTNPLLAHLRSPGPHYRGCWAVDLILGKE